MFLQRKRARKTPPSTNSTSTGSGKRGRPLKRPEELASQRKKARIDTRTSPEEDQDDIEPSDPTHTILSLFERLPTEIIQHIFFLSLETSLATTCRTFNAALSDESVFRTLILFAFFRPTLHTDLPITPAERQVVEERHFLPAKYRYLNYKEREDLQKTIWGFHWCNRDRFDACLPILKRLVMVQLWHREFEVKDGETIRRPGFHRKENEGDEVPPPDLNDDVSVSTYFKDNRLDDSSTKEASDLDQFRSLAKLRYRGEHGLFASAFVNVVSALTIPLKLFRGCPWTTEKHDLLVRLHCCQDHPFSFMNTESVASVENKEALATGMESAIVENRVDVLEDLMLCRTDILHSVREPIPVRVYTAAIDQGGRRAAKLLRLLIGRVPDVAMLRTGEQELTAWALRARDDGDEYAAWILDVLSTPSTRKPPRMPPSAWDLPGNDEIGE